MVKYEVLYILDATLEDEPRKALIEKFSELIKSNGGEIEKCDEWGKRTLAYPINDMNAGYYVLLVFTAPPELPKELERNFLITEGVMRYLVTREGE